MQVEEGEFIFILGTAGSGKSLLMKIIGFRERPDKGEVYFQGSLMGRGGDEKLRRMRGERVLALSGPLEEDGHIIVISRTSRFYSLTNPGIP